MSKYRIKKVTDSYGREFLTAQFRLLGLWLDYSRACRSSEDVNNYIEYCVYRDDLKRNKKKVDFLEPDLSRLIS